MADLDLLNFIGNYPIDNCIGVYSGNFNIPASPGSNSAVIETGFDENPLFLGLFNVPSSSIWVPMSRYYMFNDGAGFPTGYGILTKAQNGKLLLQATNNSSSVSANVAYKLFAFAQKNQGIIDMPLDVPAANQKLYFDGDRNYRKVAFDEIKPFTIPASSGSGVYSTSVFSFSHNLGYIPKALTFIEESGILMDAAMWSSTPTFCYPWIIRVTENEIIIVFVNSATTAHSINIHLRVYYD